MSKRRKPVKIRRLDEGDWQEIAEGAAVFNREQLAAPYNEVDDEFLAATIKPIFEHGMGVIAERKGKMVGYCAFVLMPLWYNSDFLTASTFLYHVVPEAQGNGLGTRLLTEAESLAKEMGARSFLFIVRAKEQRVSRAALEKGYRLLESAYTREL